MLPHLYRMLTEDDLSKKNCKKTPCDKNILRPDFNVPYSPACCQLTTLGTYCDALNFRLAEINLAYKKCENFPKLLKHYINAVGLDTFIRVAETIPTGTSGDRAAAINNSYSPYEIFVYNGISYTIRLTLTRTDGVVIYDSVSGTTDSAASSLDLHTTRMEIQRATERSWGSMQRSSSTTGVTYVYASIWIPGILLLTDLTDTNINTEVINFRFAYEVTPLGTAKPN